MIPFLCGLSPCRLCGNHLWHQISEDPEESWEPQRHVDQRPEVVQGLRL